MSNLHTQIKLIYISWISIYGNAYLIIQITLKSYRTFKSTNQYNIINYNPNCHLS